MYGLGVEGRCANAHTAVYAHAENVRTRAMRKRITHPNEDTDEGPTTTWAAPLCDRLSDDYVLTDCALTELRKRNDEKGGKQPTLI